MSEPEQVHVHANGIDFGALAWGDPGAPLALLVHGYPDTAWTWRHLGPRLARRGWRAVAPFTRGYAPTDLAPDDRYFVADLAADVLALHTALGGDERAVLVGHDWGAAAVYAATEREPTRFRRHVTLALPPPAAILKPMTTLGTLGMAARQTKMSWYFVYNQLPLAVGGQDRVIPKLWRDWSPGYDAGEDVARVLAALEGPGRRRAALRYYSDNLQRGVRSTFTVRPGAPLLYLHGEQDGCMQAQIATAFPDTLPAGSRYERVAGVGHFLHLEQPDTVGALIEDWIG